MMFITPVYIALLCLTIRARLGCSRYQHGIAYQPRNSNVAEVRILGIAIIRPRAHAYLSNQHSLFHTIYDTTHRETVNVVHGQGIFAISLRLAAVDYLGLQTSYAFPQRQPDLSISKSLAERRLVRLTSGSIFWTTWKPY